MSNISSDSINLSFNISPYNTCQFVELLYLSRSLQVQSTALLSRSKLTIFFAPALKNTKLNSPEPQPISNTALSSMDISLRKLSVCFVATISRSGVRTFWKLHQFFPKLKQVI